MQISLGKNYRLEGNTLCWQISERHNVTSKGNGKESTRWKVVGYHSDLSQALRHFAEHRLRTCDAESIQDLYKELESTITDIRTSLIPQFKVEIPTSAKDG